MGDENSLQSGTVAHKHGTLSSDGGSLSSSSTELDNVLLVGRVKT